jgi:hypothetical protein
MVSKNYVLLECNDVGEVMKFLMCIVTGIAVVWSIGDRNVCCLITHCGQLLEVRAG